MKKHILTSISIYILIAIFIVAVMFLTHPLGFNNYGYDYGFYSYAIQHTPLNSIAYLLGQVNDYGNHIFVFINWIRLPQLPTLNFLFLSFFVIAGILFYEQIKKYGTVAVLVGVSLFTLSIAQNQTFTMFLWKAAYGQVLLLLIFLLIQHHKKYFRELLPLVVLFISHKTSTIITLLSLIPYYLFSNLKRKVLIFAGLGVAGLIFIFFLDAGQYIKQLLNSDVQNGLFLTVTDYLKYSWYLIPMASYGVYLSIKSKTNLPWLGLLGASLIFIVFQITFYQRLLAYADLALIFFNVIAIYELKERTKQQTIIGILVIALALLGLVQFSKNDLKPQISETEITEIRDFSDNHQGAFVLSLSAQDATWLLANLGGNVRLASAGLFEDKFSKPVWQNFWVSPKNESFLNSFPQPLYLYERSTIFYPDQQTNPWHCLQKISTHFYKYTCNK